MKPIKRVLEDKDEEIPGKEVSFDEMYRAVTHVLINGNEEQRKKIWKLVTEGEGEWPWLKMKIITDAYGAADAKGKEEFCLMGMKRHLGSGNAIQLKDDFVDDETGIKYRQYKFKNGLKHRIPYAADGMDKSTFEVALNKHFLGDFIEFHVGGSHMLELIPLDTPEKVADYNESHNYYRNHPLYKDSEPILFDPTKDIINQTPKG